MLLFDPMTNFDNVYIFALQPKTLCDKIQYALSLLRMYISLESFTSSLLDFMNHIQQNGEAFILVEGLPNDEDNLPDNLRLRLYLN